MQKSKKLLSALMALVMVITAFPIMAFATSEGTMPADGHTDNQPFKSGSPSQNYRIPGIVTLDDGTMIAVADARWNAQNDGGGNDVFLTRSTDGGATWNYHMLNYFPDNGNSFNKSSTSFCDSSIATDGSNVYVLSTFFPAGVALNGSSGNERPWAESAFDNAGRLKLRLNTASTYDYYLDTTVKVNGRYAIRRSTNNAIDTTWTVDDNFYLYNGNTKDGSIFYSDGHYVACRTTYLWFRSSDDGGVTWNAPRLLNVKSPDEQFLGVGPGRGLVTSTGDIVFTSYTWNYRTNFIGVEDYAAEKLTQYTYLLSSSDGGYTWKRSSENATSSQWWTSESCAVELPDGTIRCYLRNDDKHMSEADARRNDDGTYEWTHWDRTKVNGAMIDCWSDCQLSAVTYPYKINGKNAVLVSCPTNNSTERRNGTIHVLLLDDNNNCTQRITYAVTPVDVSYAYSSMDVLPNGDVVLLYESESSIKYERLPIKTIAPTAQVSIPETRDITIAVGETYSFRNNTDNITGYDSSIISVSSTPFESAKIQLGLNADYNGSKVSSTNALYRFEASGSGFTMKSNHNTSAYVNINANNAGYPQSTGGQETRIEQASGSDTSKVYIRSATGPYLMFWKNTTNSDTTNRHTFDRWGGALTDESNSGLGGTVRTGAEANLFRPANPGETSSTEIPGYVKLTSASQVTSLTDYLIAYKGTNGTYYVMYPSTSTSDKFSHVAKVLPTETEATSYDITITGAKEGVTTFKISDSITYRVRVTSRVIDVTGAVKYDPVIYTQGADYTAYGTDIADGKPNTEMKTAYRVADGWTINHIEVAEGVTSSGTSITAVDGILTGTVQLTAGNNSTSVYERILLKTYLRGPDGKYYLQQDYLYVTTSPVPAHLVSQSQRYYQNTGGTQWVTIANMGLFAKGSVSDYSTPVKGDGYNYLDQGTRANSIAPYTQDGMALTSFSYTNEDRTRQAVLKTGDKIGGYFTYYSSGGGSSGTSFEKAKGPVGHYYYDKSSSYNPGIKTSNGNTATIELVMNRPYISNTSDYLHDDNSSDPLDFNEISITVDGTKRLMAHDPDNSDYTAYTPSGVSPQFQRFTYAKGSANSLQTFSVDINTADKSAGSTINGNMYIKISHGRDRTNTYWAVNESTIPFAVHVGDKTNLRKYYNKAMTNSYDSFTGWDVLVASDYTPATWEPYYQKMLEATSYLNNYNYNQANVSVDTIGNELKNAYNKLQKVANFTELEEQLELKKSLYNSGENMPYDGSNHNVYTRESWNQFRSYYADGDQCANVEYPDSTSRANAAGYNRPEYEGPHSESPTVLQMRIDTDRDYIRDYPKYAADSTAFDAAKEIVDTLDLDAYKLKDNITNAVTNGDNYIYEKDANNEFTQPLTVVPSQDYQSDVDQYTANLLEAMNVASENALVTDGGASKKGKLSTVVFQKNGVETANLTYGYGTYLAFTVVPPDDREPGTTQVARSQKDNLTVYVTIDDSTTKIPLDSDNQIKLIAQGKTITINLVTPTVTPTVYVRDYFGTLLYSGAATADQITLNNEDATVTINSDTVTAKPSPAYTFKEWNMTEENGVITISQTGTRIGGVNTITATDATVVPYGQTEPDNTYKGYNVAYTVTANSGVTPLVWKMTVSDDNGFTKDYLAAYGNTFTRANSIYNVAYTPITSEDQLGSLSGAYGKPISYGDGYISGDNKDKFTLSCFYSAAPNTTITEAGVLYSSSASMTPDAMKKGATDVVTRIQTKVSDFGQGPQSTGVYTMTKTRALTGTHYMRSYVSYTEVVNQKTVIRISYGPVYKCVDGQISIAE